LRKEFNNVAGEHAVDSMQVHNIEGGELRKLRAGNTVPEEADGGVKVRALNDRVVNPGCDSVPRGGKRLGSQVPVDDVVEICVVSLSRLLVLEDFCHGTGTARAGKVHVKNRSGHSTTLVGNACLRSICGFSAMCSRCPPGLPSTRNDRSGVPENS
jgi:hypothetical protein